MAKRVAVIDIGSNSVRMIIYEKTSRFAFHILYEAKSKVRISESAYNNNSYLQEIPMQRAFDALSEFTSIISSFKVRKTLCVATSALRDAPNKQEFILKVRHKLKLNIKVISGEKEAYFGAIACANLLPLQTNALSIDIGGGSTEFSLINNNDVTNSISLKLGTVRLKELFFDNNELDKAIEYIDTQLESITHLNISTLIGIGGTFRTISSAIMSAKNYPLKQLHSFEYLVDEFQNYIEKILKADKTELKNLYIEKNRFDLIKPGALILSRVLNKLSITNIITSGTGVREGVYLADLLRNSKHKFPHNYNVSIKTLLDRGTENTNFSNQVNQISQKIFNLTHTYLHLDKSYLKELSIASKLSVIGSNISFYTQNKTTYNLIKSSLEYGFSHKQIMLIATINRYSKNKFPSDEHLLKYAQLLPTKEILNTLCHILSLSIALLSHRPRNIDFDLEFKNGDLKVISKSKLYLSQESVEKLKKIENLSISFH